MALGRRRQLQAGARQRSEAVRHPVARVAAACLGALLFSHGRLRAFAIQSARSPRPARDEPLAADGAENRNRKMAENPDHWGHRHKERTGDFPPVGDPDMLADPRWPTEAEQRVPGRPHVRSDAANVAEYSRLARQGLKTDEELAAERPTKEQIDEYNQFKQMSRRAREMAVDVPDLVYDERTRAELVRAAKQISSDLTSALSIQQVQAIVRPNWQRFNVALIGQALGQFARLTNSDKEDFVKIERDVDTLIRHFMTQMRTCSPNYIVKTWRALAKLRYHPGQQMEEMTLERMLETLQDWDSYIFSWQLRTFGWLEVEIDSATATTFKRHYMRIMSTMDGRDLGTLMAAWHGLGLSRDVMSSQQTGSFLRSIAPTLAEADIMEIMRAYGKMGVSPGDAALQAVAMQVKALQNSMRGGLVWALWGFTELGFYPGHEFFYGIFEFLPEKLEWLAKEDVKLVAMLLNVLRKVERPPGENILNKFEQTLSDKMSQLPDRMLEDVTSDLLDFGHDPGQEFAEAVHAELKERQGAMGLDHLAKTASNIHRLGYPLDADLDVEALPNVEERVLSLNSRRLQAFLVSLDGQGVRRPGRRFMNGLADQVMMLRADLGASGIIASLASLASLGHRPDPQWAISMVTLLQRSIRRVEPKELGQLLQSLALMEVDPGEKFLTSATSRLQDSMVSFQPRALTATLWGLAVLRAEISQDLLALAAEQLRELFHSFNGHFADGLWALAQFGYQPSPKYLTAVAYEVFANIEETQPEHLGRALMAMATFKATPDADFSTGVLEHVARKMESFGASALAQTFRAMEMMGFQPSLALLDQAANRMEQCKSDEVEPASEADLATFQEALAKLGRAPA